MIVALVFLFSAVVSLIRPGQFASHEPFYQAFGIDEIPLASSSCANGLRLRQMQRSGPAPCAFPLLAYRFPIPFQSSRNT
jgi:hypothetical protein